MSLITQTNGPAPGEFYWNASGGGGGGGGGTVTGLIGSAVGSVATTVAAPLITGQGGITCTTTASGLNISNSGGGGGAVSSIVAQSDVYWTQQTFVPAAGNNQSIRLELGGVEAASGNLLLPPAISTGLSNASYTTLRIDGVLPVYEDQGDFSGIGNYFQTALAAAGTDVSGNMCYPATQFHPILSVSGSGITADSGLLLANSCFSYPFSLVLTKSLSSVTADTTAVTFLLTSTSSSNAKFYCGSSVASGANRCPMVFTLTS